MRGSGGGTTKLPRNPRAPSFGGKRIAGSARAASGQRASGGALRRDAACGTVIGAMQVVYVSPNGIGTALVRSQVLPYLRGLAERGFEFDLVTFEHPDDPPYLEGTFARPRWHALRARPGGGLAAKVMDLTRGAADVLAVSVHRRADLIHARSYLPAAIAWAVTRLTRRPYVFDMRGFLGDEYVEGRHWDARDLRYRALRVGERLLLQAAGGIVVLTEAAAERLRSDPRYAPFAGRKPVTVTPCAVDLERFRPATGRASPPTVVYSGSLGMSYALDAMLRLYAAARASVPGLRFLILNRKDHALIAAAVARHGLADADIVVRATAFDEVPALLGTAHVGLCLLDQVSSKEASSPIKVGEYLACGLPVIVNRGIGDVADEVRAFGAGLVLEAYADDDLQRGASALVVLLGDERARANARRLAEERYGIPAAVERYAALYARVLAERRS